MPPPPWHAEHLVVAVILGGGPLLARTSRLAGDCALAGDARALALGELRQEPDPHQVLPVHG